MSTTDQVKSDATAEETRADTMDDLDIEVEVDEANDGQVSEVAVSPLEALQAQVVELESAKKENYERFVRVSADLENTRKRARRDVKDARIDERSRVLKDVVPVIDNLERALAHAEQQAGASESNSGVVEGVKLVLRQFTQALERHEVKAVDASGKPFDPTLHEAVSQLPTADHPPGIVVDVLQAGYTVSDRLLRPALVVVSQAIPEPVATESESPEENIIDVVDSGDDEPTKAS